MTNVMASEIAKVLGSELVGRDQKVVTVSSLINPRPFALTFANALPDDLTPLEDAQVVMLVRYDDVGGTTLPHIGVRDPRYAFAVAGSRFFKPAPGEQDTHPTAVIHERAEISRGVQVGPHAVIEADVVVGPEVTIGAGVLLKSGTRVGRGCRLAPGTVVGERGFGFAFGEDGVPIEIPHFGGVEIGEYCDIGCRCVVSAGVLDDTVLESHVKINDHSRIAHNARIGARTIIAGAAICGSVQVGPDSWIAPGAVVRNKVRIGAGAFVGMGAVVVRDVPDGVVVIGNPAQVVRKRAS